MNKKYIDKEEWIGRLEEELSTCKNEKRKEYLTIWINAIKCQPTLDEKEIIRKPSERVVERLEECKKTHEKRLLSTKLKPHEKIKEVRLAGCYINAIKIVKEECGINE